MFALDPVLTALAVATMLLMTMTALPLVRRPHWIFRHMEFPRLQLAVLAAMLIVADLYLLDSATLESWGVAHVPRPEH